MATSQGRNESLAAEIAALDSSDQVLDGSPAAPLIGTTGESATEKRAEAIKQHFEDVAKADEVTAEPTESTIIADLRAKLEASEADKVKVRQEAIDSAAMESARLRIEADNEIKLRDAKYAEQSEALAKFEEQKRLDAIKISNEEWTDLVADYGEERATREKSRLESQRQREYDFDKKLRLLEEKANAPVQVTRDSSSVVSAINTSFEPFNEIAKPYGTWSDFTKHSDFQKFANDAEFKELFSEAFERSGNVVVGAKPSIAKAAAKRLAELMGTKPESKPVPSPQQRMTTEVGESSLDDGKAEDLGAFARQLRAAQKNGTLQKFGEKLTKDLRQPIH